MNMNFGRKFVLSVVGVVAIASLIAIVSPRAVQAVAAALVQVTNTPTNAVPALLAPAASQIYQSYCFSGFGSTPSAKCYVTQVPAGQTLFVETVSIETTTENGNDPLAVALTGTGSYLFVPMIKQGSSGAWDIFVGTVGARMPYKQGANPFCSADLNSNSAAGVMQCSVYGYLAPAQ
jgi:hypothetical protein